MQKNQSNQEKGEKDKIEKESKKKEKESKEDENENQEGEYVEEDEFNVPLSAMEEEIKPKIFKTINTLTKEYNKLGKYQLDKLNSLLNGVKFSSAREKNYNKICETILKQIKQTENLVNEFSDFARMPKPLLKENNIIEIIKSNLVLLKNSSKDIKINFTGLRPGEKILEELHYKNQLWSMSTYNYCYYNYSGQTTSPTKQSIGTMIAVEIGA